jgi:hypothetical protein
MNQSCHPLQPLESFAPTTRVMLSEHSCRMPKRLESFAPAARVMLENTPVTCLGVQISARGCLQALPRSPEWVYAGGARGGRRSPAAGGRGRSHPEKTSAQAPDRRVRGRLRSPAQKYPTAGLGGGAAAPYKNLPGKPPATGGGTATPRKNLPGSPRQGGNHRGVTPL